MKKLLSALVLCALLLTSCSEVGIEPSLAELPSEYTLEAAKADGCIVYENLDITAGQENWDAFLASVDAKKSCAVRLYFYATLNPDLYTEEHYEELAKDYPKIEVYDLSYHRKKFTVTKIVDGETVKEEFAYLLQSEDEPLLPSVSGYSKRIVYFLSDTPDITWMQAVVSSNPASDKEPYHYQRVYCDYIRAEE
ncbi:MAG: hypothetical protein IJ489_10625 [Clostridia bacterium]|nr:hypothetical protein [Clostridia bacterium]